MTAAFCFGSWSEVRGLAVTEVVPPGLAQQEATVELTRRHADPARQ